MAEAPRFPTPALPPAPAAAGRPGIGAAVAAARRAQGAMLRNHGGGHAPVSNLELFFDLVYVFAITQISGFLHHHLDPAGIAEGAVLFCAVWWVWIYTTWATNWLDPDRFPVRLMLLGLMLLGLVMAVALPGAFAAAPGGDAARFAAAYVAQQLGRSLLTAWFFRGARPGSARNMVRIAAWFAASALPWALGAESGSSARLGWWALALGIEYAAPLMFFAVPGLGRSSAADWDISGSHMAERCSLVVLIALGEGIVVTGSAFAGAPAGAGAAFILAFLGSALLWWLYFDIGAARGAARIAGHSQAGRIARNAYTYLHMPIVAGIVVGAVADALVMERAAMPALVAVQAAAMALFVGGLALFKRFSSPLGNAPLSHLVALALFAGLAAWGWYARPAPLDLAAGGVAILTLTALWEWGSFHGGWMELMEARGWRLAGWLRARFDARRAARAGLG